jgi:hypothetical protein
MFSQSPYPAAGPGNGRSVEYIDFISQVTVCRLRQADANYSQSRPFSAGGYKKGQSALSGN